MWTHSTLWQPALQDSACFQGFQGFQGKRASSRHMLALMFSDVQTRAACQVVDHAPGVAIGVAL